ncbi:MAG: FAD-dependent thymidylate synthase [Spirochaetaceae bacterium]|nr:FAD-dependent thymidylate synthase [Spirochaetaceae bacterium]
MITLFDDIDKTPLSHIGKVAGICWNSDTSNTEKNIKRAKDCIASGHLRTAEYPDVEMVIEGYSARMIRELYTHIVGTSRLQASTRYIDYNVLDIEKDFYYPETLDQEQRKIYKQALENIKASYKALIESGLAKEDAANLLPLAMHSKIVFKINLRALIHLAEMRCCTRAYREFRNFMAELKATLSVLSDEWKWICDTLLQPKCQRLGYCDELKGCGRKPQKQQ